MLHRFLSVLIVICTVLSMACSALAAPPAVDMPAQPSGGLESQDTSSGSDNCPFDDITHHWAKDAILACAESGLVNGVSPSAFAPNKPLTRAMFVTILGRLLQIDPVIWAVDSSSFVFKDVKATQYFAPYVNWAVHNGITNGVTDSTFAPNQIVTREQMATFIARTAALTNYTLRDLEAEEHIAGDFADEDQIASWAKASVTMLKNYGIFNGIADADDTVCFYPNDPATRAQGCVVFDRLSRALIQLGEEHWVEPASLTIINPVAELEPQQIYLVKAQLGPSNVSNPTLVWSSSNPDCINITPSGLMTWKTTGAAMITVTASNGLTARMFVKAVAPPEPTLAFSGESYAQKCTRIFGAYVSEPRTVYKTPAEAEAHMTSVAVHVWDINSATGEKYTRTLWLQVHENIAPTVNQIFAEIYADPSQPPIKNGGGYRFCATSISEHTSGLAIDLNWEENYYCSPDGTALTGKYFKPGVDPYSIPVNGVIETIFRKYGFTRGIYWRNGTKDYMHFSFFGT